MKCIRLLSTPVWKLAKKHVQIAKEKKKNAKENTESNKSSNQRKCPKSDWRNWEQLKIVLNTEINLWETRAVAAIMQYPKYFYTFVKNNSTIGDGIEPLQDEEGNLEPSNKRLSNLLNEQYNSVFSTTDPTMTIKYPKDFIDTHKQVLCQTLILQEKTS